MKVAKYQDRDGDIVILYRDCMFALLPNRIPTTPMLDEVLTKHDIHSFESYSRLFGPMVPMGTMEISEE